jgi:transcriptional regulator of met regulon
MQPTVNANNKMEEIIKRQDEMQYEAMAHALSGQPLPDDFVQEYAALEKSLAEEALLSPSDQALRQMNEMQYAAMAHALSGQPLPDDFGKAAIVTAESDSIKPHVA